MKTVRKSGASRLVHHEPSADHLIDRRLTDQYRADRFVISAALTEVRNELAIVASGSWLITLSLIQAQQAVFMSDGGYHGSLPANSRVLRTSSSGSTSDRGASSSGTAP